MDATFWLGIFVGAVLSLLASVVANLYTDRIQQYISVRRRIRLDGKKASELKTYSFVQKLRTGDPTSLLELNRSRDLSLQVLLMSIFCLIMLIVLNVDNNIDRTSPMNASLPVVLMVMALVCLVAFLSITQSISRKIKKARDFEQYETDIRTKWGNDVI